MTTLFNCILAEVKVGYNLILTKGNSDMKDYKISRLFSIPLKTKRVTSKQDIHRCPPPTDVIKLNCDGSSIGAHPSGAIGIVIRDSTPSFMGAIASNIGNATAIEAEFSACMMTIEKAKEMQLKVICLETDSLKVVNAYNKNIGVPWKMKARWYNCMKFCHSIVCSCTHVFREGNQVADALAKHGQGLSMLSTQWWPHPPPFLSPILLRDSLGLPTSRMLTD